MRKPTPSKVNLESLDKNQLAAHFFKCVEREDVMSLANMLSKGFLVDTQNPVCPSANTPLHHAISNARLSSVAFLLDHGANPYQQNTSGSPALHLAIHPLIQKRLEMVKLLLDKGVYIDCLDGNMETCLSLLIQCHIGYQMTNDQDLLALLVERSADVFVKNQFGSEIAQLIVDNKNLSKHSLYGLTRDLVFDPKMVNNIQALIQAREDKKVLQENTDQKGLATTRSSKM